MIVNNGKSILPDAIAFVVIVLMAIGTVFVFSASASLTSDIDWRRFYDSTSLRQILFFPLAVAILFGCSRFDYKRLALKESLFKSPIFYFLIFSCVLLALVLTQRIFPFLSSFIPKVNQHYRWLKIPLGPATMSFQPSELAKWALLFFLVGACIKFTDSLGQFKCRFLPLCCLVGAVVFLIVIEDLGGAIFLSLLAFSILAIGGAKWRHLLIPVPFVIAGFGIILLLFPARMQRITSFLNPGELADSSNYQAGQSLIAIGSGGFFGKGLGRGICKYGHLPEDTTDFIFAIIGEELGFFGTAFIILLFIAFVLLAKLAIRRCDDPFGKLLASAIVLTIGLQAAINIGVVTVVLPTKGIPLPFVSAGGTGMLLSAAAVGILLNIVKQAVGQNEENEILQKPEPSRVCEQQENKIRPSFDYASDDEQPWQQVNPENEMEEQKVQ